MIQAKKTAGIYTLGCKVNQYESEAMAEELARFGVKVLPPTEVCDGYLINTCTVTAESDRKARQFIRRAIAQNPQAVIVVTGCLAQTAPESITRIVGVDAVIGNTEKLKAARELARLLAAERKNEVPFCSVCAIEGSAFEPMAIGSFGRTRAYVKIEDGCESRCTYCIIPSARGKIRSKLPEDVLHEVSVLTQNGCREVVLTGIETASWGKDLPGWDLATLLEKVNQIPGIGRIRLGSLDPSLIRPAFAERIGKLSSLAPHFHLSLQSGSSSVLARMKRKYNAEQAMEAIDLLRNEMPMVQFTTDVIVGFPGETEEEFEETVAFVRKARFLMVHIFPYSPRKGTPAAAMNNQIPETVKRERLHRLEAVEKEIRQTILQEIVGRQDVREVLFEQYENSVAYGHTADFLEVAVSTPCSLRGEVHRVMLQKTDGTRCFGILADEKEIGYGRE